MKQAGVGVAITGCGAAAPDAILTNEQLSAIVETSDEWIHSRTGMRERHILAPGQGLSELGTQAAARALAMAAIAPESVDLILLATSTPDDLFGSAGKIQMELGATRAVAFDLTAACSGFVFGLVTAAQFIRTGLYQTVVVIGADALSRWVDWHDRTTCVLFGDGAGAVVMQADEERDRLRGVELCSDGRLNHTLNLGFGGKTTPLTPDFSIDLGSYQPITMNGREIYRFAVAKVPDVISKALFRAELDATAIDWLILHQANQRIIDAVAQRMKISSDRVISNIHEYGNTSAASIPLALDGAVRSGKIQAGQVVAIAGFGAGLSWGAAIFEWGR
ncbi:ketoacyl-ACP synthase III [Spirulina major CS-329]|uniref:beta-ketoacyl-ACP synthase III n=1 Tax=Spirulina TaxID=1154 RepID=UPI00232B6EF0|nr:MULTISPECIES: beta-ketoacyl-ACP synthase III [Spirulina]MDB9496214.1 ketoacyl-ACP synthase III [Spirulina subsalsa CS-330]MDB9504260.1 ketoacyl-ACP synthase III [Spirulina major CS-329]